ncbi:hypothetical protein ACFL2S_15190, partial [Thermodesulfobacteriota bacterium]
LGLGQLFLASLFLMMVMVKECLEFELVHGLHVSKFVWTRNTKYSLKLTIYGYVNLQLSLL